MFFFVFFVPFRLVFMSYSQHHASHWVQRPSTSLCSLKRKRSETETGISYWSVGCTWLWINNVPVMQDKCADHTTSWGIGQSGIWGGYASKWVGVFSWDYCLSSQIKCYFFSRECRFLQYNTCMLLFQMFWNVFVRLARPSQVSLVRGGESAIKSMEEIGIPVQYEFRVRHHLMQFSFA